MKNAVRKIIKRYMNEADIDSFSDLCKLIGMCRQTLYDRMDNPGSFRGYELKSLDDELHFSNDDLAVLIRGK